MIYTTWEPNYHLYLPGHISYHERCHWEEFSEQERKKVWPSLKVAMTGIIFWILDISAAVSPAAFPVCWDLQRTTSSCPLWFTSRDKGLRAGVGLFSQISALMIWKHKLLTSRKGPALAACIYILITNPWSMVGATRLAKRTARDDSCSIRTCRGAEPFPSLLLPLSFCPSSPSYF